jgi:hypothetical protein
MNVFYIALAAFAGGIVAAVLGYLDSETPFQLKKFLASVGRALVAGALFAARYSYSDGITPVEIAIAFVTGAGFDVLGNRGIGAIKSLLKKGSA